MLNAISKLEEKVSQLEIEKAQLKNRNSELMFTVQNSEQMRVILFIIFLKPFFF